MEIKQFKVNDNIERNDKLDKASSKFKSLLSELRTKELEHKLVEGINQEIEFLNTVSDSPKVLINQIRKKQYSILKLIEKEAKLVVKNHYRNLWMAVGMSAIGFPIGFAIGSALDNLAFLGIGIPIGMAMGLAIGINMDKKAKEEGRQLDFE